MGYTKQDDIAVGRDGWWQVGSRSVLHGILNMWTPSSRVFGCLVAAAGAGQPTHAGSRTLLIQELGSIWIEHSELKRISDLRRVLVFCLTILVTFTCMNALRLWPQELYISAACESSLWSKTLIITMYIFGFQIKGKLCSEFCSSYLKLWL